MGSDTGRFAWEASWHSFSNFEVFLIRDFQSWFLVQSHRVDRHHIPQNLIWSSDLVFLVNSSKNKSLIFRKEECFLHQEKAALSMRLPSTKKHPTNKPPHLNNNNKKQTRKTQTNTRTADSSHWNYFTLPLIMISYRAIFWWLGRNIPCSWRQILQGI